MDAQPVDVVVPGDADLHLELAEAVEPHRPAPARRSLEPGSSREVMAPLYRTRRFGSYRSGASSCVTAESGLAEVPAVGVEQGQSRRRSGRRCPGSRGRRRASAASRSRSASATAAAKSRHGSSWAARSLRSQQVAGRSRWFRR